MKWKGKDDDLYPVEKDGGDEEGPVGTRKSIDQKERVSNSVRVEDFLYDSTRKKVGFSSYELFIC